MMRLTALVALVAVLAFAGCSEGEEPLFPEIVTLGEGAVYANILNSSLAVGENRIVVALTDADDQPVRDAAVRMRFFDLTGDDPRADAAVDATFVPVTRSFVDERAGGELVPDGDDGAYVATVAFSAEGAWGVKFDVTIDGCQLKEIPFRFTVAERSSEPQIGELVPPSVQQTLASAGTITEIDTSSPPRPRMHNLTIADALALGRPAVIAFATPAYCTSRLCAPVMSAVMDPLLEQYGDRASFIHIEPYALAQLRDTNLREPVRAMREWGLTSEPWVFVVGADGRLEAKFEGIIALDEVERALQSALSAPGTSPTPAPP